jgi:glutamate racemase
MKIGVFDSGIGGLSVAKAVEAALPDAEVIFIHDKPEHFPYATKTPQEIFGFVGPIFQELVDKHCDVIVVACNTVSTTLITRLRGAFSVPLVAMEPMVKPAAALTKTGVIAVCATPVTLASERYNWLKETYGQACTFVEPDCSEWSLLIEHDKMNDLAIRECIEPALEQDADVIVLGCTHYHWIEEEIKQIVQDKAIVIQPESAIVAQVKRVLNLM